MTKPTKSTSTLNMLDSNTGATMILMCAALSIRAFAGDKPFISPSTGETLHPCSMPSYLYQEIAQAHAILGEVLRNPNNQGDDH